MASASQNEQNDRHDPETKHTDSCRRSYWENFTHDAPAFILELKKLTGPITDIALAGGAAFGVGLLEPGPRIFITFFLFLHGRRMISFMRQIGERIAGARARRLLTVIGMTVKGVV